MQPEIESSRTIERLIRPDGTPLFLQRNYNEARKGYVINAFRVNGDVYASSTTLRRCRFGAASHSAISWTSAASA